MQVPELELVRLPWATRRRLNVRSMDPVVGVHHVPDGSSSRSAENAYGDCFKLLRAIRATPWLFPQSLAQCVVCGKQLQRKDSVAWSREKEYNKGANTERQHMVKPAEENNPETLICRPCHRKQPHVWMQWCSRCHGPATTTALARAYLTTQKTVVVESDVEMSQPGDGAAGQSRMPITRSMRRAADTDAD